MADDGDDEYRVGYGRPPKGSRFPKGRSGNPSGRRKGQHNIQTLFDQELATRVTVLEGGRSRRRTMAELVAKQVVAKAAQGNPRFVALLLAQLGARSPEGGGGATTTPAATRVTCGCAAATRSACGSAFWSSLHLR